MKKLFAALALSGLLATSAQASLITFQYTGLCVDGCARIGLAPGNAVGGYITTTTAGAADGRLFGFELVDFAFSFGTVYFDISTHTAFGRMDIGPLGQLLTSTFLPFTGGYTFAGRPTVSTDVILGPITGWEINRPFGRNPSGAGIYSLVPTGKTAVPEPGTLALLGLGLFGAAAARRRAKAA